MPSISKYFKYPGFKVNHIQIDDLETTVRLINSAYSYMEAYKDEPRTSLPRLKKRMGESELFIAKQRDEIVGCFYVDREDEAVHFGLLAVIEKLRGTGLAPALIKAVEAYARALGADRVDLDYMSISPWLKPYYEKLGYSETGAIVNWGTIDLIRMVKPLG
jgi:GNAT superfamily N-acetyltransferase